MANSNYIVGSRLERLWCAQMRQQGYKTVRSAGSKGQIDCIAWNDQEAIYAQIKNGGGKKHDKEIEALRTMPRPPGAKVVLVVRDGTFTEWEYIQC